MGCARSWRWEIVLAGLVTACTPAAAPAPAPVQFPPVPPAPAPAPVPPAPTPFRAGPALPPLLEGTWGGAPWVAASAFVLRPNAPVTGHDDGVAFESETSTVVILDRPHRCEDFGREEWTTTHVAASERIVTLNALGPWPPTDGLPHPVNGAATHVGQVGATFDTGGAGGSLARGSAAVTRDPSGRPFVELHLETLYAGRPDSGRVDGGVSLTICPHKAR